LETSVILPNEIRPPKILERTMAYLVYEILDRTDRPFTEVHGFVRDRSRSIRQDFTYQHALTQTFAVIHEVIARFHIVSGRLVGLFLQGCIACICSSP
jgi:nuclear mRNA export protein SAC3